MFGRRGKARPVQDHAAVQDHAPGPADVYTGLRSQVLTLDPADVGLATSAGSWGVVMETGYPNGTATLVCLCDGTTSLYTSSGFGIIGGGAHEEVVRANARLLAVLEEHLDQMAPSADRSLPGPGRTVIRALTADGQRLLEAAEDDLGEGRSVLSPVFHAAHAVITQLRLIEEQRR